MAGDRTAPVADVQLPDIQSRLTSLSTSSTLGASDEAVRRARALADYEADRDLVKERVRREKVAREARAKREAEEIEEEKKRALEAPADGSPNTEQQEQDEEEDEYWGEISTGEPQYAR